MRTTADILTHSLPNILAKRLQIRTTAKMLDRDNPLLQRLRGAGFTPALMAPASASNTFPTGLFNTYIDIDYSTLIAEQKIKVVEGREIKRMNPCSITLNNDTELKADEIVSVRNTISEYEGDRSLGMGWRIVWGLCEVSMKKEK